MDKEKETIDAEVVDEKPNEEKKQGEEKKGGIKGFFSKLSKSVSDTMLEADIRSNYEKNSTEASLFLPKENFLLGNEETKFGALENDTFSYWENKDVAPVKGAILLVKEKYYRVATFEQIEVKTAYNGIEYTRKGFKLTLDPSPKEINVVKADKKYFIFEE